MSTLSEAANPQLKRIAVSPEQREPGGLWITLARQTTPTTPPDPTTTATPGGLWTTLQARTDLAQYSPVRPADVVEETISDGEQTYTVLRSANGTYLRLSAAECEIWHAMDGTRTVAQLATLGFLRFKQLLPVAGLVQNLKQQGFLTDTPINIYRQIQHGLEQHTAEGWGRRLLRFLQGRTFPIRGIDMLVTRIYRGAGRIFFTRPFLLLHALVSLAGVLIFVQTFVHSTGPLQVLAVDGVTTSLPALWVALLISFGLHELAHALAVKHYGRTVWSGGVMLYYGMPAAFVDTSDIWLAGRRARMVVSAAGPLSDLLVGGGATLVASLFATELPGLSAAAYKLAFACYVATLFNLNPLLELDGYYMLVDALRLPNLRRRALAFIAGPMWAKLRTRTPFSPEERIFGLYGLLTSLYTLCAIVLAFLFWQQQLVDVIRRLWAGDWGGQLLALLIIGGVVVPVALGLLLAAWSLLQAGARQLERRKYAHQPGIVALLLLLLVGVLTILPFRSGVPLLDAGLTGMLAPLLWSISLSALLAVRPNYRGADVQHVLHALLLAGGITLLSALLRLSAVEDLTMLRLLLEGGAFLLLLLAGFAALLDVDLHQASQHELGVTAFLLVVAFGLGGATIHRAELALPGVPFWMALAAAAPVYFGTLALALLLPHLLGLRDSRLRWCWLPLWAGIAVQTGAYGFDLAFVGQWGRVSVALSILTAGLWAVAWCVHYVTLRTFTAEELTWPAVPTRSEAERLQRGFQLSYVGCYRLLRAVYGSRRAQALDDRMDILASTANWDVTLDREQVRISPVLAAQSLDTQGGRYAEVLRYTVATIEEIAGARFARKVIQAAYDALPWAEREAMSRRSFPHTPWARDLSRSFGSLREARLRLLRQVDLFLACDDAELDALAGMLQSVQARAGETLIPAGTAPTGIWIVEAGEVVIRHDQAVIGELHRGMVFGAIEQTRLEAGEGMVPATTPPPTSAGYQATVASTLLFLSLAGLRHLPAADALHTRESLQIMTIMQLLERMPLFAEVPRRTLRELARAARQREVPPRTVLVRENQSNGTFYIIKQGQAAVIVRTPSTDNAGGTPPGRRAEVVSQLGPEEFFGEMELLRGTAPVASVVSLTPMLLLELPHATIAQLLLERDAPARSLEEVGTGRLLHRTSRFSDTEITENTAG
jgi:putative peptide zinc metalloprotease protein